MKTTIKLTFTIGLILMAFSIYSQTDIDALRYSRILHGGTARNISMGGAFSSLGGDFSTLSSNPAGIAMYKKSEMVFSPFFGNTMIEAKYLETKKDDFRYNFNLSNFGFIFAGNINQRSEKPDWRGIQFGIGVNRLQNFNGRSIIQGFNDKHTILDAFVAQANGIHFDNLDAFGSQLAFNTYLIDTVGSSSSYTQAHFGGATQRKITSTKGGINEMVMSFGANYDDKLYLGATLGFPFLNYEEINTYSETDTENNITDFNSLTITDELRTFGTGFNMKAGFILRATDWLRISGAAHTPTFFSLTDEFSTRMQSKLENKGSYTDESPLGRNNYSLMTPGRLIGGIGFILPKIGMLSFDYERVNYSRARLRERDIYSDFSNQNDAITSIYQATNNFRAGVEIIFNTLRFRGGYAYYGSPFKHNINDGSESFISGGIGLREKNYFIDIAYNHSLKKEDYFLYTLETIENLPVNLKTTRQFVTATFGFRF